MKTASARPKVDVMFRAFSDRTRLRILSLLRKGELCVCDIVAVLGVPQPKASRHLGYLRRAGLVNVRKEGLWCHYTLLPAKSAFHAKLLECLSNCFHDVPELSRDQERLSRTRCVGGGCCG